MKKIFVALFILEAINLNLLYAQQAGDLDSSFNSDGIFDEVSGVPYSLAIQTDGKIVAAGSGGDYKDIMMIVRINDDGSLDNSFGNNGVVLNYFNGYWGGYANDVAVDHDGKIIVSVVLPYTYNYGFTLFCYNSNGTIDSSFGNNGLVTTSFNDLGITSSYIASLLVQPDGKIVAAGSGGGMMLFSRYNSNGSIDSTFGNFGKQIVSFLPQEDSYCTSIEFDSDNNIVALGRTYFFDGQNYYSFIVISKLKSSGLPDSSFSDDGKLIIDEDSSITVKSMAVQTDDKIIVCGSTSDGYNKDFSLIRLNKDGAIDSNFGINGYVKTSFTDYYGKSSAFANTLAIQSDGKIVAAGGCILKDTIWSNNYYALARYKTDGSIDSSFGIDGKQTTLITQSYDEIMSLAIDSNDKIVAAGRNDDSKFIIARYLSSFETGILNLAPSIQTTFIYPNPIAESANLEYELQTEEVVSIHLFNAEGKLLKTFLKNERQTAGKHNVEINFPAYLPSGSYSIEITSAKGGSVNIKVVK